MIGRRHSALGLAAVAWWLGMAGCHSRSSISAEAVTPPPAPPLKRPPPPPVIAPAAPDNSELPLHVPHRALALTLDGEQTAEEWQSAARTHAFSEDARQPARPFSEARFLWDEDHLYLGLYAADDNLQATEKRPDGNLAGDDHFTVMLTPQAPAAATYVLDVSAAGTLCDVRRMKGGRDDRSWQSGARFGVDRDGTLNDARDKDEEWVIEMQIPLKALGISGRPGTRLACTITRCDTPRGETRQRCGSFGRGPAGPRMLELELAMPYR